MVIWLLQVIKIGSHSYETHPPSAQERLHVFTKSQDGCTEVAQVHQRAVVKVIVTCYLASAVDAFMSTFASSSLCCCRGPHWLMASRLSARFPEARCCSSLIRLHRDFHQVSWLNKYGFVKHAVHAQ